MNNDAIINLIVAQEENDHVDFKKKFYSKDKKDVIPYLIITKR